jgi:hypothetical protein
MTIARGDPTDCVNTTEYDLTATQGGTVDAVFPGVCSDAWSEGAGGAAAMVLLSSDELTGAGPST